MSTIDTPEIMGKALPLLADAIQAPDDVPAFCLHDAAAMIERQSEELAALRRNRAAWEASGQDAEKRSRYAEARALLLEAEITRLGKEIARRDQSLASRRKICRELVGLVRPLKARVGELEDSLAATRRAKSENDERFMTERDDAMGKVRELETKCRELEVFSFDLIADIGRSGHKLDKAAERIQYLETLLRGLVDGRNAMPSSRGTTSGELLQLHDRAERPDAYAVADSEGGEA